MTDTTITLIGPRTRYQDAKGVWRTRDEARAEVLAMDGSITRGEFFAAGQIGLRPDRVFTVFAGEYNGEEMCEHDGTRYAIYRTYHPEGTDYLELYAQIETGVHAQTEATGNGS